jgi:chromosome segregation ATPase
MNEDRKSFCLEGEKERVRLDFPANQMSDKISHVTSSTYPELDALYEEREKNGKLQTQLEEHQKELENNATQIQQLEKEILDKTLKVQELEQDLKNNFPSATGKLYSKRLRT